MTKINLKQIVEQLNEVMNLNGDIRVAAVIDDEKDNKILGWCLSKIDKDGNTTVISKTYKTIKELFNEKYPLNVN